MSSISPTTRFANVSRKQAALILTATAAAMAWCLLTALRTEAFVANGSDQRLYRRIVECVRAGEDYYQAAGREMRAAGYPTGSIFNWRPPLYAWLIGTLPTPGWARLILTLIAVFTMLCVGALMAREGGITRVAVGALPLIGAFSWPLLGDCFLFQELWAGIFIALSICCYARDRWQTGLATGLLALFFRELALPYCLIALFLAFRQQRRREVMGWLIGLSLFGAYMVVHGLAVVERILPGDRVHASWIQFGGAAFLMAICRMNAYLYLMPLWASALYLPLALLGLAAWRGGIGERFALTGGAYAAAFAVVGQPFNDYWGLLTAPLLACGFAAAPEALWELCLCVRNETA
jgi:hypothetical protein